MAARLAAVDGGVRSAARGRLCAARVGADQGAVRREAGAWRQSRALAEACAGGGTAACGWRRSGARARGAAVVWMRERRFAWRIKSRETDAQGPRAG